MKEKNLSIPYALYQDPGLLPPDEAELLKRALEATDLAHAPFSGFLVGCALGLEGGEIILGNNQENVAFPSGLCAERTALFYAGSQGKAGLVRKMAIRAISRQKEIMQPPTSCGACRQVMVEYEKMAGHPIVVLMQGAGGEILRLNGVAKCMLPFNFDIEF